MIIKNYEGISGLCRPDLVEDRKNYETKLDTFKNTVEPFDVVTAEIGRLFDKTGVPLSNIKITPVWNGDKEPLCVQISIPRQPNIRAYYPTTEKPARWGAEDNKAWVINLIDFSLAKQMIAVYGVIETGKTMTEDVSAIALANFLHGTTEEQRKELKVKHIQDESGRPMGIRVYGQAWGREECREYRLSSEKSIRASNSGWLKITEGKNQNGEIIILSSRTINVPNKTQEKKPITFGSDSIKKEHQIFAKEQSGTIYQGTAEFAKREFDRLEKLAEKEKNSKKHGNKTKLRQTFKSNGIRIKNTEGTRPIINAKQRHKGLKV